MGRTPVSKMRAYRCTGCKWVAEARTLPNRCHRCRRVARCLQPLSSSELSQLMKDGQASWCDVCEALHAT